MPYSNDNKEYKISNVKYLNELSENYSFHSYLFPYFKI